MADTFFVHSVRASIDWVGWLMPGILLALGYFHWRVWWLWAGILLALRFLRIPPITISGRSTPADRASHRYVAGNDLVLYAGAAVAVATSH